MIYTGQQDNTILEGMWPIECEISSPNFLSKQEAVSHIRILSDYFVILEQFYFTGKSVSGMFSVSVHSEHAVLFYGLPPDQTGHRLSKNMWTTNYYLTWIKIDLFGHLPRSQEALVKLSCHPREIQSQLSSFLWHKVIWAGIVLYPSYVCSGYECKSYRERKKKR